MNTLSPVEQTRYATSMFRVYLRSNFYPMNQKILQESIYSNIQNVTDIDCSPDSLEYKVKCKKKKSITADMYHQQAENMLIAAYLFGNLQLYINNDNHINDNERYVLNMVYNDIKTKMHFSSFLKMQFNLTFIPTNASTFLLSVAL